MTKKTIAYWLAFIVYVEVFYPDTDKILAIGVGLIISVISNVIDRILYDTKGYW